MNSLELAHQHLGIVATTDARDKRERSSAIAQAAAQVAAAEAMHTLCEAIAESNELVRRLVEVHTAPTLGAAEKIRESLKPKTKPGPEEAIG